MTTPDTTPPPLATPAVIGYAGADAIQLDLRALARVRLGTAFLIASLAGAFVRMALPFASYPIQILIASAFTLCFVTAACLLAANTGLRADRPAVRRLLVIAATALAVATAAYVLATFLIFGTSGTPNPSKYWIFNIVGPFNTVAYATTICLSFLRLATLARHFGARATAVQCTVAAVLFLSLQAAFLSIGLLARFTGISPLQSLSILLSTRPLLSLWAIIVLAFLRTRLKPTQS